MESMTSATGERAVGRPPSGLDRDAAKQRLLVAAWVGLLANLGLSAIKLVAGILGHSGAVVADAVHSISDVVTDLALILGVRYWSAPADDDHPHGHGRIETLVTVGIGLSLTVVGLGLGWNAVRGIGAVGTPAPTTVALLAALLSLVSKEGLFRWTVKVGREVGSSALVANAWHHRSDALSSLPAALAVALAMVDPRWIFIDSIGAIIVCHFILRAAWQILRPAMAQLVDVAASEDDQQRIESLALAVDGVIAAHALRTRYLGSELAVDLHVEVDSELSVGEGYKIARAVRRQLLERGPGVADVLVQIEPYREER